jgi:hypothetical protein
MKAELEERVQDHWRWMRPIVKVLLPRGVRERHLTALDAHREPPARLALAAAAAIGSAYKEQLVAGFSLSCFLAEMGLLLFCFIGALRSLEPAQMIPICTTLGGLTLRRAYTFFRKRRNSERAEDYRAKLPPIKEYYLDSVKNSAMSAFCVLITLTFINILVPSAAVPVPILVRISYVALPLMTVLPLIFQAMPDPKTPFEDSGLSATAIFMRVCVLNVLWIVSVFLLIVQDVRKDNNFWVDFLRGFLPLFLPLLYVMTQRDPLARHDRIETPMTDWKTKRLIRIKEMLPQGIKKGQPFYWLNTGIPVVGFALMAASLGAGLLPWLHGGSGDVKIFQAAARILAFAVPMVTWKYIKTANHAAAKALQKEIDARGAPTSLTLTPDPR